MSLFIRFISILTVMLTLGVIAVSAYAAKTDVVPSTLAYDSVVKQQTVAAEETATPAAPTQTEAADPIPTIGPAPIVRYPAPLGATSVGSSGSGRGDNLSVGFGVQPILSIPPRPVNPFNLVSDGLVIPLDQLVVMRQVGVETGVPWQILAGIAKVESNFGQNMTTSSAGAIGYGQFLPAMWEIFGEGGNPYDFNDVIPAMARYLLNAGAPDDIPGSLYSYNRSWAYVDLVLSYADAYGYRRAESTSSLIWPVLGPITTPFVPGDHYGIDIGQAETPGGAIRAAHDGVVLFAGGNACCGYGYYVTLVGASGIVTLYAHMESFAVVEGQTVRQGDRLGASGCTGRCTGPHLHFEVSEDGVRYDPLLYLP